MDYTKNYHLPQWKKEDRIMMEDFNQMCLDLEGGLTERAGDAAKAWDGLLRVSRHMLSERLETFDRDKIYCVNGLLFNPLTSAGLAETLSGAAWNNQLGVYAGRGETLDPTILRASCTASAPGHSNLDVTAGNAGSSYSFVAPVTGEIKGFSCYLLVFFSSSTTELMLDLTFTAEKKSGTKYTSIYQKKFLIERTGTSLYEEEIPMEVNFPIEKGAEYRLKLTPTASKKALGRYGFLVQAVNSTDLNQGYVDHSKFVVQNPFCASVSHTRSFPTEGPASRAAAVVRYRKEEAVSTVTAALNGLAMTRLSDEVRQDADGAAYREAWFHCTGDFNGNATLKITLAASGNDDMRLLEYAVMLL